MNNWKGLINSFLIEAFIGAALAALIIYVIAMSTQRMTFIYQGY